MSSTIKCTNCGAQIEVSQALAHEVEEKVLADLAKKHQVELDDLQNKNKQILAEMTAIEKSKRELRDQMEKLDFENQKKLNAEIEKVKADAMKIASERTGDELAVLKKQIDDYKKSLDDANYKLSQKSQQLQGEVLELDLEKILRESFSLDEISPVAKGIQGADVIQIVKGQSGREAGIILWETKDAKWTPSWLPKLREDGRKANATVLVLVSKNLPKDFDTFQILEGVIVTSPLFALGLAGILRRSILQIAVAKQTAEKSSEKLESLYDYLQSEAFRHRFESFAEGVKNLQDDLESERRAMERVWKTRETSIRRMSTNVSRMYGELQGVMENSLPEIKTLALPEVIETTD